MSSSSNKKKSNKKKTSTAAVVNGTGSTADHDGNNGGPQQAANTSDHSLSVEAVAMSGTGTTTIPPPAPPAPVTSTELEQLLRHQMILGAPPSSLLSSSSPFQITQQQQQQQRHHAFWDTQPMPHPAAMAPLSTSTESHTTTTTTTGGNDNTASSSKSASTSSATTTSNAVIYEEGPIVPNKDVADLRAEPYSMPSGFHWSNVNVSDVTLNEEDSATATATVNNNSNDIQELYTLLSQNYVEDDDELFRFDYSIDFLKWALQPPGCNPDYIFGVRTDQGNKLVAFISGIPTTIQIHANTVKVVEINFLCVHKKLRSKRLAPVLIKEITRRVNLTGIFQAVYTAGTVLPVPVSSARYYHRNLNPKKLVDIQFSRIGQRMTMARMLKLYKLPEETNCAGLRPMIEADVISVHTLLNHYLSKFALKIVFTVDEIRHWLLPRKHVIDTYVVCNNSKEPNVVTDMISFYHLPSNILRHADTKLYAAYSFYNVATTIPYIQLMKDALILAKHTCHCDVYNALNVMDNHPDAILKELKFGIGDGTLQYYIYNWATNQTITSSQLGIVLL